MKFGKKIFTPSSQTLITLPINYEKSDWRVRKQAREQYCEVQEWKCWYCGEDLRQSPCESVLRKNLNMRLFPKGMLDNPIHLHHNHKNGMTIGAVHARCNCVLWQYHGE